MSEKLLAPLVLRMDWERQVLLAGNTSLQRQSLSYMREAYPVHNGFPSILVSASPKDINPLLDGCPYYLYHIVKDISLFLLSPMPALQQKIKLDDGGQKEW